MNKDLINIEQIFEEFVNPPPKENIVKKFLKSKESVKQGLFESIGKAEAVSVFVKTSMWRDIERPEIVSGIKEGFGKLVRNGLEMSETEIKVVISNLRSKMSRIADMRYLVEEGERAKIKLAKIEAK